MITESRHRWSKSHSQYLTTRRAEWMWSNFWGPLAMPRVNPLVLESWGLRVWEVPSVAADQLIWKDFISILITRVSMLCWRSWFNIGLAVGSHILKFHWKYDGRPVYWLMNSVFCEVSSTEQRPLAVPGSWAVDLLVWEPNSCPESDIADKPCCIAAIQRTNLILQSTWSN